MHALAIQVYGRLENKPACFCCWNESHTPAGGKRTFFFSLYISLENDLDLAGRTAEIEYFDGLCANCLQIRI